MFIKNKLRKAVRLGEKTDFWVSVLYKIMSEVEVSLIFNTEDQSPINKCFIMNIHAIVLIVAHY